MLAVPRTDARQGRPRPPFASPSRRCARTRASTASPSSSHRSSIRCGTKVSARRSTISGTPGRSAPAVALALHRTTLEALTNVRKHADAASVAIELAFRDDGRVD